MLPIMVGKSSRADSSARAVARGINFIVGPPGTGKTTTIAGLVRELAPGGCTSQDSSPVIVCSLTRAAAREAAGRNMPIPAKAVGTLHSFAYRAIGAPEIVGSGHIEEWNRQHPSLEMTFDGRDAESDDPVTARGGAKVGDSELQAYDLLRHRCISREKWPRHVAQFGERWEAFKADAGVIDFTDIIERAECESGPAPMNPSHVIVDEAQDFSRLELNLLKKWACRAQSLTLVGDPFQALYVWRGAHPAMFDSDHPKRILGQSYRVPRAVHAAAVRWIRRLSDYRPYDYAPRDHDGRVSFNHLICWHQPETLVREVEARLSGGGRVLVLASCGYMLCPFVAACRDRGIPFANPLQPHRGQLNPLKRGRTSVAGRLSSFIAPMVGDGSDVPRMWTRDELAAWAAWLRSEDSRGRGVLRRGAKSRLSGSDDDDEAVEAELLKELVDEEPAECQAEEHGDDDGMRVSLDDLESTFTPQAFAQLMDVSELPVEHGRRAGAMAAWWAENVTTAHARSAKYAAAVVRRGGSDGVRALSEPPRLHISTIHGYKGGEADHVFILPDLSLSGAKEWAAGGTSADAVVRMFYVALTRSKHEVIVGRPLSPQLSAPVWECVA